MEKEYRLFRVVYKKTVSVEAIIDDSDPILLKMSLDNGATWASINKSEILSAIPVK